jgi:hypothetical protein
MIQLYNIQRPDAEEGEISSPCLGLSTWPDLGALGMVATAWHDTLGPRDASEALCDQEGWQSMAYQNGLVRDRSSRRRAREDTSLARS